MKYCVRIVVITILGLLLMTGGFLNKVRADEPVTIIAVIGIVVGVADIAANLWAMYGGGDHTPVVTTTTTVTTQDKYGHTTTTTTTKSSDAPATIAVPADFPNLTVPLGFNMSEVTSFQGSADQKAEIYYQHLDYGADVTADPPFASSRSVLYDILRVSTFSFLPPSSPSQASVANLSILVSGLSLSTIDLANTSGYSSYAWSVQSPQLGTIFSSSINVPQGGWPVVNGDIPASAFTLSAGSATLDYSRMISVNVPAGLAFVNFTANFETRGQGSMEQSVGGIVVPVDKLSLLAHLLAPYVTYVGLASTILAAMVAAICVRRVQRRKEK